mmetsp:Transcript_67/g.202  ORF Transcript_67/g.202 Transcript_67/m.202 type:complete len:711 (+) Transcript_67:117-2249(+)
MWGLLLGVALVCRVSLVGGAVLRRSGNIKADDAATSSGIPEQDMLDMLTSLNEVVVSTEKEHKAFQKLSSARENACQNTKNSLEVSIKEGSRSMETAQVEMQRAMSEVESIQGDVATIKSQVKLVDAEIAKLQKELASKRAERQAAIARDSGYTQEVKAILSKATQRIDKVWTRSGAHKVGDAELIQSGEGKEAEGDEEVREANVEEAQSADSLDELSADALDDEGPDGAAKKAASDGKKALAKDAADVQKAAQIAREAFELEEMRLMDLIKAKRKSLKPLEASLADRQPELANQLKKISEANRTVAMSKSGVQRDKKVLERSQAKCSLLAKAKKFEGDKRPQVRGQVVMAVGFLKTMAKAAGVKLTPGAELLSTAISFLQMDSAGRDSSDDLSEAVRNALHNIEALSQDRQDLSAPDEKATDDSVPPAPESNLVQVSTGADSSQAKEATDSLKNVKEMISNLIASLREEQNQDKEKNKFCEEQQKKSREGFKKLSAATEDAEQARRWAESAVLDLQAQAKFLTAELGRLKEARTSGKTDLDAEIARIKDEAKIHAASREVLTKSRDVLKTHCKLTDDKKGGNCGEADAALNRANLGLETLDKYLATYIVDFGKITEQQQAEVEATLKVKEASLFQANADLNRRKDELAELSADLTTAKENMKLAGKADDALSTSCGPKAASMEDTIARRKEEIEQLKNAVKVLDGEAFI